MPHVVTKASGRRDGASAIECMVRYEPRGDPPAPAEAVQQALENVGDRCGPWAARIAEVLSRQPSAPVVVTVAGGWGVCRTRGSHVMLPLNGDGSSVLAGLAHELVHAVAGRSASWVLDEGLAVQVDSQLQLAGPSWPYYHLAPDRWMEVFREEGWQASLSQLQAAGVARSLPEDHLSVRQRAVAYLHAASLCRHLLEHLDPDEFWSRYFAGRLIPDGGDLLGLQADWLSEVARPLTGAERRQRDRSFGMRGHGPDSEPPTAERVMTG